MKVRCIKNYEPGFFGFDYRDTYQVGEQYVMYSHYLGLRIFAKENWNYLNDDHFRRMFVPIL